GPSKLYWDPALRSCPGRTRLLRESFRWVGQLPRDTSDHTSGLMLQKAGCFADFSDRSWDKTADSGFARITANRRNRQPNSIWCTADDVVPTSRSQDERC